MKRSAQPFPSGSRTKAGELAMPRKRISAWKSWLTYWLPWSWRSRRPAAMPLAKPLRHWRTACLTGSRALEAIGAAAGMKTDALGRAVIDGDDCSVTVSAARVSSLQGSLTLAGHDRGQIGAPHDIHPLGGDRAVVGARAVRPA